MQGIYTYIPETNHVPREHRVAAILMLLFMVLISLVLTLTPLYSYLYVSTFRSVCAVPNKAVFCSYYYYYYYYYYYFLGISFMQGIYTYIPETNHVPREHCFAAILVLLFDLVHWRQYWLSEREGMRNVACWECIFKSANEQVKSQWHDYNHTVKADPYTMSTQQSPSTLRTKQ